MTPTILVWRHMRRVLYPHLRSIGWTPADAHKEGYRVL